jgi:manganese/zinc/iron transport system permease protein
MGFFSYFFDPVLRAPMLGCILMSLAASLVGVIVVLRKESLIGEALSHAAYPGVVLGLMGSGIILGDSTYHAFLSFAMLGGAAITALLGMKLMGWLKDTARIHADAALCFVLSFFFGIGITLASHMQFSFSNLFRQVQIYFYGQAATMTDIHVAIYGTLALVTVLTLFFFRKEFKAWIFDPQFAKAIGLNVKLLEKIILVLVSLSIVIGIRSVGVVLMSAMLIAPAVAARQCSSRLRNIFLLAAMFGILSACIGTYLANEMGIWLMGKYPGVRISLPTGPMIVLTSSFFCLAALLFAPEKGAIVRLVRIFCFRAACLKENLLKTLWSYGPSPFSRLQEHLHMHPWHVKWILCRLARKGLIEKKGKVYYLTEEGLNEGAQIIRLHRLWELYLTDYVGITSSRVHASANQMEHILTPEIEKELISLLDREKNG